MHRYLGVDDLELFVFSETRSTVFRSPVDAQRLLLTQLAAAGARLHYHNDFDWGGLRIGNYLVRELRVRPWRFGAADYLEAIGTAVARHHPLKGIDVLASWDENLTSSMREQRIAIAEEAVVLLLMSDLGAS